MPYDNFVWVLDTQSGGVKGYRFVQLKDEKDAVLGWRIQNVPNVPDAH